MSANKMNKAQLIEVLKNAGVVYSEEMTKKELVKLYEAQKDQIEEVTAEMNETAVVENEVATEVNEETAAPVENENEVPVVDETADQPTEGETAPEQTEGDAPAADAEKPAEKENKRRNGKSVKWFVNGEEKGEFPSIKAAATYFKDELELPHMPFTPIMKSIRQGIDWNENSFQFASAELQAEEENKYAEKVIEKAADDKNEEPKGDVETADQPSDDVEPIEEITEVPAEEIN